MSVTLADSIGTRFFCRAVEASEYAGPRRRRTAIIAPIETLEVLDPRLLQTHASIASRDDPNPQDF
jgi:hypothetical protein